MIFVYTLICPIDNAVKYIGITTNPEVRFDGNLKDPCKNAKTKWIKLLKKKKLSPIMKIIDMVPEKDKFEFEHHYISLYLKHGFSLVNTRIRKKNNEEYFNKIAKSEEQLFKEARLNAQRLRRGAKKDKPDFQEERRIRCRNAKNYLKSIKT